LFPEKFLTVYYLSSDRSRRGEKMSKKTRRIVVYLPDNLYEKIMELKEKGYRSINEIIRDLIRRALKEEVEK